MIFEQALYHLPEILTGSGYSEQSYESGIVSAFSLAVLQALNGRNVPNPISCLHAEKPYRGLQAWPAPPGSTRPRYLRADLNLRLHTIRVGNPVLASYGWRHDNWLEAKFFRGEASNAVPHTGQLLADLLRLLALVPSRRSMKNREAEIIGRYLLHVYEGLQPEAYLSINRQVGGGSEPRKWLTPLITQGKTACEQILLSENETEGVLGQINSNLADISFAFNMTTLRIEPVLDLGEDFTQYTCILSRVDSFSISRNQTRLEVRPDRTVVEPPNPETVKLEIREHIGKHISAKAGKVEDKQPDPGIIEIEEEEEQDRA